MPTIDIHTVDGGTDGTVDLDDAVFSVPLNVPAMHQVVVAQLAAARTGSSKTLRRGEVRGGGRKPYRQKGTGRARQGSTRAPQWAGGGVAHGPTGEENYTKRVSKKLKKAALRSALSDRARSGDVMVLRDLAFDVPSTKAALAVVTALELTGRRVLLVLGDVDDVVMRSFRNLGGRRRVHLLTVDQLNTYDVLVSDTVVFVHGALPLIGTGARAGAGTTAPPTEGSNEERDRSPNDREEVPA